MRYRLSGPWLLGLRAFRRLAGGRAPAFRILFFHDVPKDRFEAFRNLVGYVKRYHGVVSPEEAATWLLGAAPARPAAGLGRYPCLFAFDDGFASNYALAKQCLAEHGVKALFFVCPGLIELPASDQRAGIAAHIFDGRRAADSLPEELRLMSWTELEELGSLGHCIGCHGMSHRRLSLLEGDGLRREIVDAGDLLERRLGGPVSWFAFAFGDIDSISRPALRVISEKYRFCRSGLRGSNAAGTEPMAVFADHIDLLAPTAYRKLVLEGGLDIRYRRARRRLNAMVG